MKIISTIPDLNVHKLQIQFKNHELLYLTIMMGCNLTRMVLICICMYIHIEWNG